MADSPKGEFDGEHGTNKIRLVVKDETSDKFTAIEKTAKRWHVVLALAVALVGGVAGAVKWETGLASAHSVEVNTADINAVKEAVRLQAEIAHQERQERAADRASHDDELRWIADKMLEFKTELDDVARATGAPVKRGQR